MVKNHRGEQQVLARFGDHVDRSVALGMARTRVRSVWSSVSVFLASTAIVAAVWLGGRQIQAGQLTAGELVAFIWYGLVVTRGMAELSGQYGRIQQMLGSAARVVTLLDETPEETAATPSSKRSGSTGAADIVLPDPGAAVEFRAVTMTYPGRPNPAVTDLSFVVQPGESVALVGPSGAGKSTIARLLLRHYEPDSGSVRVGGVDVRSLPLADLRRSIAVIPQDAQLLSDTVAANLRMARPEATDGDLINVLQSANAWDFVAALPDGLDTVIGERATTLSGGQQQRVAIARALLLDAPVLVLDEATSALDARGEASVQDALLDIMATRSTVVIAHRLTTIRHCDRVVVVSAGRIVEQGAPNELFAKSGGFADMVRLQG
jgi:ATP-binding cassette subfamily B protein